MNRPIVLRLGLFVSLVAMAASVAGQAVTPPCTAAVCPVPVKVAPQTSTSPCHALVSPKVSVANGVQEIHWRIGTAGFRFDNTNGIRILNSAGHFTPLPSASGQEFNLKFNGQGQGLTYEYELNIVPVEGGASCQGPAPTARPRIKNE